MARITSFWIFFCVGLALITIGAYKIIPTEITYELESNKHMISYYQQPIQSNYSFRGVDLIPNNGNTNIEHLTINFTTSDIFAVNNPYDVNISVILKHPEKISNVVFTLPTASSKFDVLTNATELFGYLNARGEQHLIFFLDKTQDSNFAGRFHLKPLIPDDYKAILFLFTPASINGTKATLSVEKIDISKTLITVKPYTDLLRVQSDENSNIQILNTNRTNDVVEGLTWVIVGAIPLEYAIESRRRNQEKGERHRRDLYEAFIQTRQRVSLIVFTLLETLEQFPDKKQFLEHISTAHPDLYKSIEKLISLERETKALQKLPTNDARKRFYELKPLEDQARDDFKKQFDNLEIHMRQKVEDMGGICENCIKFHDVRGMKFKEMKSRLDSFTMPF